MHGEQHFIDSAFQCRVTLDGTSLALYNASHDQFERLKRIRSLGFVSRIHDVARHTRHQHLVGLMRVFGKLSQLPPRKGLPKTFLWSFWVRTCYAQVGHAAMSYDSEKAVLLAAQTDAGVRSKLRSLLQPAIDAVAPCTVCSKPRCASKSVESAAANQWFDDVVTHNRWRALHRWVAATKLMQEQVTLAVLHGQTGERGAPGFSTAEAIKLLIAPKCEWEQTTTNLNRLDYIVRDLAYAGTLGVRLDVDQLIAEAHKEHADWNLLEALNGYMSGTLYESLDAQMGSVLFQRALASRLISRSVTIEELFGFDARNYLSDDDLVSVMLHSKAGKEALDDAERASWKAWTIGAFIGEEELPLDVERDLLRRPSTHLTAHTSSKVSCFVLSRGQGIAFAMRHRSLADRPDAKSVLKLFRNIQERQYPRLASSEVSRALLEGLLDLRCEHGTRDAVRALGGVETSTSTLKRAATHVISRARSNDASQHDVAIKIGGFEYPLGEDPQLLQLSTMHAALSGSDKTREDLGVSIEAARRMLWTELLSWQGRYFGSSRSTRLTALVDDAQNALGRSVVSGAASAAKDLELYCLLEALRHPDARVLFRTALPGLVLFDESGNKINEYDVFSVSLDRSGNAQVTVWGVTTEDEIQKKRADDLGKIAKVKDLLGRRWESDIRVATCYVFRDGGKINLDVDGVLSTRAY